MLENFVGFHTWFDPSHHAQNMSRGRQTPAHTLVPQRIQGTKKEKVGLCEEKKKKLWIIDCMAY